jgi:hypothetical protein
MTDTKEETDTEHINVEVPSDLKYELRKIRLEDGHTLTDQVIYALQQYTSDYDGTLE